MGIIGAIMRWSDFWRLTPGPTRKLAVLSSISLSVYCYMRACMTGPGKQTVCASQEYKGCTELLRGPPPPPLARSPREPTLVRRVELAETYGLYTPAKPPSKASNASELDFSDLEALADSENSESTADFCAPATELFTLKQGVLWQSNVPSRWCETCQHFQLLRTKHCRDCGFCVTTYDHHCVWLGQCVGERNRHWFLIYCVAQQFEFLVVGREVGVRYEFHVAPGHCVPGYERGHGLPQCISGVRPASDSMGCGGADDHYLLVLPCRGFELLPSFPNVIQSDYMGA